MNIAEIEQALKYFNKKFPQEAVEQAMLQQEEITPILLDSLDYVNENLESLMKAKSDYMLHIYAMFLLAQFREKKAFPKLIEMISRGEDAVEFLIGGIVTEDLNTILFSTFDGNIELLHKVIENTNIYQYSRSSAIEAFEMLYEKNIISKEDLIKYFQYLINDKLATDESYAMSAIVSCIRNANLIELAPDVKRLYERGIIETWVIGDYEYFLEQVSNNGSYKIPKQFSIDNVAARMNGWACFEKEGAPKKKNISSKQKSVSSKRKKISTFNSNKAAPVKNEHKNVGRNDPCPCGSGKKYKNCCLNK